MLSNSERRKAIIEKAKPIFARFGLKHATMESIAKCLNLRKGALYYYFKSKDELLEAVIERECELQKNQILNAIKDKIDPIDKIGTLFLIRLKYLQDTSETFTTLKGDFYSESLTTQPAITNYFKWEYELSLEIINVAINQGYFHKELDSTAAASTIILGLRGIEYQWATKSNAKTYKSNITSFLKIVSRGLSK